MNDLNTISNRIEKILTSFEGDKRGSISRFCKKTNISTGNFANWISGKSEPSSKTRQRICEIYGLSNHWLETGEGQMSDPSVKKQAAPDFGVDTTIILKMQNARLEGALDYAKEINEKFFRQIEEVLRRCSESMGGRTA